jgi:response regulator NasT
VRPGEAVPQFKARSDALRTGEEGNTIVRVVIAEDDSIVELGLRRMLKSLGHEVAGSARNGKEAFQLVQDQRPDIAILDIRMPEVDGLEAARRIGEKCPVPILMLTAFTEHKLIKEAAESGAFAYLLKPVSMNQLEAAMNLAVARFKDHDELRKKAEHLENELENRKFIEKAKEILADYLGISEGEALQRIQEESRRQRRKVEETAKAIIATCEIMSKPTPRGRPLEERRP